MSRAPVAATPSGVIALTVAAVPTGMNTGVSTIACGLTHHYDALADLGSPPRRNAGQRLSAAPEFDLRKAADIGLRRCKRQQLPAVAAEQDRRMRFLDRMRRDAVRRDSVMLPR